MSSQSSFIFFGTSRLSVIVLETLAIHGLIPKAIITSPDRPKGRKLILTPPLTKIYGDKQNIPVLQFEKLDSDAIDKIKSICGPSVIDFFLVASYGLIIPQAVLDIPKFGTLNIHPSLLPKYRGATPIQQAILDDEKNTGITIMLMDAKMDHGPILIQEKRIDIAGVPGLSWPKKYDDLEEELAVQAANILEQNIDKILSGEIVPVEQNHADATFTKKIQKPDGLIHIDKLSGEEGYKQFLKFNAFHTWPTCFFFVEKGGAPMRVKITDAIWSAEENTMKILKVIPEGQKEVAYSEFLKRA